MIQDGGRPPSWKIEKRPYLGNGMTDLHEIDTMMLIGHLKGRPMDSWNFVVSAYGEIYVENRRFLANVTTLRSLYAIAILSVVCLSVVCDVGAPYSAGCDFRHFFTIR